MLTLEIGKELDGRYVIQGSAGTGAYGSVWRATDKQLGRDVALKRLLKRSATSDAEESERLLEEARRHAQLVHTNIVQVYDVIECEGEHLIVMEFVDGPSLHDRLRELATNSETLPLDKAVSILSAVLGGVSFAHARGIVHRDLTPSNLLLTATGIPKIGDFGIAREVSVDTTDGSTSTHGRTGNAAYMAPELGRGEQADESTDLFTVGIIGYLLIAGCHPFAHSSGLFTIPELIADDNFVARTPKAPSAYTTSQQRLYREYSAVILRLLHRERAGRFKSAREAIEALEAVEPFQECSSCGERFPEHYTYCGYCGQQVEPEADLPTESQSGEVRTETPEQLVERGYQLSRSRRWEEAISLYEKAINADASNQKAYRNISYALNRVGRHEKAEEWATRGLTLGTDVPSHKASIVHERALARAELKKYDEALEDVNEALRLLSHSYKSRYLRAKIHVYRGALDDARADANEVLRRIPDHTGALRVLEQID